MGRPAAGVNAIRRAKDDFVTAMEVVDQDGDLLVATVKGYGKRTPLKEYSPKGRATGGVATIAQKTLDVTGRIAAARVVRADDDLTIITAGGQALRLKVKQVRRAGRGDDGRAHDATQRRRHHRLRCAPLGRPARRGRWRRGGRGGRTACARGDGGTPRGRRLSPPSERLRRRPPGLRFVLRRIRARPDV